MSFQIPNFSRKSITRAGDVLIDEQATSQKKVEALNLINLWRACHAYPVNTFNSTLRSRVKKVSKNALVAQRLKRVPSIEKKLIQNANMQLARMQDIGGLRAVLENIGQVRKLEALYKAGQLTHVLDDIDDYITNPKESGYRSLHLIYRYYNPKAELYNGYYIELQIRTQLQHAWATAVETIGTFLNQALKSSEGSSEWLTYFKYVSAAFAIFEKCPKLEEFNDLTDEEIFAKCVELQKKLGVKDVLQAFSIAANAINSDKTKGTYHLIILSVSDRSLRIISFAKKRLEEANIAYAEAEKRTLDEKDTQVVLVATDKAESLKRAYPNYFLDTKAFVRQLNRIEKEHLLSIVI